MKNSLVLLSIIKQKARQLKKEKTLKLHQAYDEAARYYGYTNFQNYKNIAKEKRKDQEDILKIIFSENDMFKKINIVMSFFQKFNLSFSEQLNILNLFQDSNENAHLVYEKLKLNIDLHDLIQPWLQFVCEKLNFMKDEIQSFILNDFLNDEGKEELHDIHPYFVPKEIFISDLMYEIKGDILCVEADYNIKLKFHDEYSEIDEDFKDPYFNDRETSGSFGISINKNKKITYEHADISF